ncbi:MAG: type II toxin-antitoxin system VapC family toxin [Rickettsia endosymbiont of Ixodes persulcatus]|nr:type II toxin-antitoxin system VapC family toxin [Rickettsia endosymbiont of Ixodes persulcatus]MCZ6903231.1 type II toxin-antitoxin system VapC family toxin [Rickettsia endosymbiont of Ixodes persulcatus]MCZ6908399.1 type II toxin-antitoxin system VapC family toxin [Rickettsia endosymbiont of Ixodes persulcatus]MCZ6910535.1 type II toxin-antitoxin system VapC family toxin [Rickettsia endosymbiont of Ixodes persulcatus]MCZ6914314.1 type II toxin-antitoxin system VapC family toxin [Rickettsia
MPGSLYFINELAIQNKLSTYDASYLELAIRLNAKIATFDENIMKACHKHSVEVLK